MGRILAIDYGRKRVGIAVTDPLQMVANGLKTVHSKDILTFLQEYCQAETVEKFIVGKPKQLNNQDSEAMNYVRPFVEKLQKQFPDIPVILIDERFTSSMASQTLIQSGVNRKTRQNKQLVDTISATIILESYLEANKM